MKRMDSDSWLTCEIRDLAYSAYNLVSTFLFNLPDFIDPSDPYYFRPRSITLLCAPSMEAFEVTLKDSELQHLIRLAPHIGTLIMQLHENRRDLSIVVINGVSRHSMHLLLQGIRGQPDLEYLAKLTIADLEQLLKDASILQSMELELLIEETIMERENGHLTTR